MSKKYISIMLMIGVLLGILQPYHVYGKEQENRIEAPEHAIEELEQITEASEHAIEELEQKTEEPEHAIEEQEQKTEASEHAIEEPEHALGEQAITLQAKSEERVKKEAVEQSYFAANRVCTLLVTDTGWWNVQNWSGNTTSSADTALRNALATGWAFGYEQVEILLASDIVTFDGLWIPKGKVARIKGVNPSNIDQLEERRWIRYSPKSHMAQYNSYISRYQTTATINLEADATLQLEHIFLDDQSEEKVMFGEAPGCIATGKEDLGIGKAVSAINCKFRTKNHWWSVATGYHSSNTIRDCVFYNTKGYGPGGLILLKGGVANCSFVGENAPSTALLLGTTGAEVEVTNCNISGYSGWNPAVWIRENARVVMKDTTVDCINAETNLEAFSGAVSIGIEAEVNAKVSLHHVTVLRAAQNGIVNCGNMELFHSNVHSNGYAGLFNNGTVKVCNSDLHNNKKHGVHNTNVLTLADAYVYNNNDTGILNADGNSKISAMTNTVVANNLITGIYVGENMGFTMDSGSVRNNTYHGVYINSNGTFVQKDGSIHNNNTPTLSENGFWQGAGITNIGTSYLQGGYVDSNCWSNVWNHGGTLYLQGTSLLNCQGLQSDLSIPVNDKNYWKNNVRSVFGLVNDSYGTVTIGNNGTKITEISGNSSTGIWSNSGSIRIYNALISRNDNIGIDNNYLSQLVLEKGTIQNNGIGIVNNDFATTKITGATLEKSVMSNLQINGGEVSFLGGSILDSNGGCYGVEIQGNGVFRQYAPIGSNAAGSVRNNAIGKDKYIVYEGAACAVGKDGKGTGVYLTEGASMTIEQPLKQDIKVASKDRYTGKVIAYCKEETVAFSAQQHLKLTFDSQYQKTTLNTRKYAREHSNRMYLYQNKEGSYNYQAIWEDYLTNGGTKNGVGAEADAGKTVAYRKGNGLTGASNHIIVSQKETTYFDKNLVANGLTSPRLSAKIRTSDEFTGHNNSQWRDFVETYWGETNAPRAESVVYLDKTKDISKSIFNSGWATTKNGDIAYEGRMLGAYRAWEVATLYAKYKGGYDEDANHNDIDYPSQDDGTEDILNPDEKAPEEIEDDLPKPEGISFFFDGNHQDSGTNFTVRHVTDNYQLPLTDRFYKQDFSGQGWSVDSKATYLYQEEPNRCRKPKETISILSYVNLLLESKEYEVMEKNGNLCITQFMVWDKVPDIFVKDCSITTDELEQLTEKQMMEKLFADCIGIDQEDGILVNNQREKGVMITDFSLEEVKGFQQLGSVTITYVATDGVGNIAEKKVNLWIIPSTPKKESHINRVRQINETYYRLGLGKAENDLSGYKNGGLMPTDKWYTQEAYKAVITDAFSNLKNEDWEVVWRFSNEDKEKAQTYIKTHGMGNLKEKDALRKFYDMFATTISYSHDYQEPKEKAITEEF